MEVWTKIICKQSSTDSLENQNDLDGPADAAQNEPVAPYDHDCI